MRRVSISAIAALTAFCCLFICSETQAASYLFEVPEMRVVVTVQPDASAIVDYRIVFRNQPGAHPIDVVDVGMPKKGYEVLGATIDGRPAKQWKPSTYIDVGPEVHLGAGTIAPGGKGVFTCRARVPDMVYEDSDDPERASIRFTPTWFGEEYVVGETQLLLVVAFPEGVDPDQVVWHSDEKPFFRKGILDPEGAPFVSWQKKYPLTGPMMFGCSFPRSVMDRVLKSYAWTEFLMWWDRSAAAQQVSGGILLMLIAAFFLFATRGTGCSVLLVLLGVTVFIMFQSPHLHLALWPILLVVAVAYYLGVYRRKPRYLAALASVEGGRICRGLTPPEAAILMDTPMDRVLAMIFTSLLDKGAVRATSSDPLQIEPAGSRPSPNVVELPDGRRVSLEPYEVGFVERLEGPPGPLAEKPFQKPIERLIGLVRYKMTGFDVEATREYYRRVVDRAWQQIEGEPRNAQKDALAQRHINWLALSDDYDERMADQRGRGWHYRPAWHFWGSGHHWNWSRSMRQSLRPAADSIHEALQPRKVLDLSKIDRFTLDTLSDIAESASSGGGGCVGGGCACACAGCACACACAGGGR